VLDEAHALAQQRGDRLDIAQCLTYLGAYAAYAGEWTESVRLLQDALSHWEELGDPFQIGYTLFYLGTTAFLQGDYEEAASLQSAAVACYDSIGDARSSHSVQFYLALAVRKLGDIPRAVNLVQAGLQVSMTFQDHWLLGLGVQAALVLIGDTADPERCARLLGAADALRQATGFTPSAWERLSGQSILSLREQLEQEGFRAAYREGRSLSFEDTVSLARAMLEDFSQTFASPASAEEHQPRPGVLSPRELEVLRLVADGLSDKQIARELAVGERTARRHVTSIFNKLGADNRPQAVALAFRRGLVGAVGNQQSADA
jgi:DNA-binding CsgD family transcriptional regulator/tetratricopeptide (TPR) repeat protein